MSSDSSNQAQRGCTWGPNNNTRTHRAKPGPPTSALGPIGCSACPPAAHELLKAVPGFRIAAPGPHWEVAAPINSGTRSPPDCTGTPTVAPGSIGLYPVRQQQHPSTTGCTGSQQPYVGPTGMYRVPQQQHPGHPDLHEVPQPQPPGVTGLYRILLKAGPGLNWVEPCPIGSKDSS